MTSLGTFDAVRTAAVISNPSSGAVNDARRFRLDFGTLTNSNTVNATSETITIVYRVVVINSTGNNRDTLINNSAALTYTGGLDHGLGAQRSRRRTGADGDEGRGAGER